MTTAIVVNRELLDTAERLAAEYSDHTAGAVLRCFARAVRHTRMRGVALAGLPGASEALARAMLDDRPLAPRASRSYSRPPVEPADRLGA